MITQSFKTFVHKRANYQYRGPMRWDWLTIGTRFMCAFSIIAPITFHLVRGAPIGILTTGDSLIIYVLVVSYAISVLLLTFVFGFRLIALKVAYFTAAPLIAAYLLIDHNLLTNLVASFKIAGANIITVFSAVVTYLFALGDLLRNGPHDVVKKGLWVQVDKENCFTMPKRD